MKKKLLIFNLVFISLFTILISPSTIKGVSPHSTKCTYKLVVPSITYRDKTSDEIELADLIVNAGWDSNIKLEFSDSTGVTETYEGSYTENFKFNNKENKDRISLTDSKGKSRDIYIPNSRSFCDAGFCGGKTGEDFCPPITVYFTKNKGLVLYFEGANLNDIKEDYDLKNPYGQKTIECSNLEHNESSTSNDSTSNSSNDSPNNSSNSSNSNAPTKSDFVGNRTCGGSANVSEDGTIIGIRFHENLPKFTNTLYDILKIATPVIIIITGMLDLLKAVTAQKEDDMKKATRKFLNRLLAGVVVFLVWVIIETIVFMVIPDNSDNAWNCVHCFLENYEDCKPVDINQKTD